eukprot:scaffold11930_cov168-Isochrysis_galbana.AAC.3
MPLTIDAEESQCGDRFRLPMHLADQLLPRCTLAPSCERREWQMLSHSLRLRGAPCARTHARKRRRRAGGVRRTDGVCV